MTVFELAEQSSCITHIYRITPDLYYSFQRCSNDYNPLHTDESYARAKGFRSQVMYGNILNAFVSHFIGMLLSSRDVMIQSQDISFHRPVYMGDELFFEAKVDSVSEAVQIICYKLRFCRRVADGKLEVVAKGHVQIGII